jgi:hypothetical protein
MDYLKWNRTKLIDEIKIASQLIVFKIFSSEIKVDGSWSSYNYQDDDKLRDKTDPELRNIYFTVKKYDAEFQQQHRDHVENNQFYNKAAANADYSHWCKQPYWTIDEGIALILGKDPRKVKWDDVKQYAQHSAFVEKFQERRETAQRYVACKELTDSNYTGYFLAWAQRMGFGVPAELISGVEALGVQIADWPTLYKNAMAFVTERDAKIGELEKIIREQAKQLEAQEQELKETERQSLYKLLSAMAYDGYGYQPAESKSPTPNEIANAVTEKIGETIDTDTVRKWLRKATDKYPRKI